MSKIILDDQMRSRLNVAQSMTEVCDANGTTVGYFVTPDQFKKMMYAWAKTQFTDEEAERAWDDDLRNGGVSTSEALERAKHRSLREEERRVNYSVVWPDAAQDQLADQYLAARLDGREADFSQAVSEIEVKLVRDPLNVGESRTGSQRVLIELPAMVSYLVDNQARVVTVAGVRFVP